MGATVCLVLCRLKCKQESHLVKIDKAPYYYNMKSGCFPMESDVIKLGFDSVAHIEMINNLHNLLYYKVIQ